MAEENARQKTVRQAVTKERARQAEANRIAILEERERQRKNRGQGQQPLQQYLPRLDDAENELDFLESVETGVIIPLALPSRTMFDISPMIKRGNSQAMLLLMQILT